MNLTQYKTQQANEFYDTLDKENNPLLKGWKDPNPLPTIGGLPHGTTGFPFSGHNALALTTASQEQGFQSPLWLTYEQAQRAGGSVKKGAKATKILAYAKTPDGYKPFLMNMFNQDQINGIDKQPAISPATNKQLDALIEKNGIAISHNNSSIPHFDEQNKVISLPSKSFYTKKGLGTKQYYADVFRQAIQNEFQTDAQPGTQEHAKARLRQELACMWGMSRLGLPNPEQHEKQWAKVYHEYKPGYRELDEAVKDAEQGLKQLNIERPVYQPLDLRPADQHIKPANEPLKEQNIKQGQTKEKEEEIPF